MSYLPGSMLGILGSGQLGLMLALAAKRLGYSVHVFSPDKDTPAGQVANREITAPYADLESLRCFAREVDVVTIEFENIPAEALKAIEAIVPVYPQPHVLETTQNRLREKHFLSDLGIPIAPFRAIHNQQELEAGLQALGCPSVLKTAGSGYDGKGQAKLTCPEDGVSAFEAVGRQICTLEQFIDLDREISVIAARGRNGEFAAYRPVENRHKNHILDVTLAPAQLDAEIEQRAIEITRTIMEAFQMRGLLCVEFFITRDGQLLVNELAPRTHNSGHYSIEAAACSQFEQQLRAVCGLPLGDTHLLQPAAMTNLLGGLWQDGEPDWAACLAMSPVYLHLYGKKEARPGRKMGHITALSQNIQDAEALAIRAREVLMSSAVTSQ